MKTLPCFLFPGGLLCTVTACDRTKLHGYDEVAFPETVENLSDVNSPADDAYPTFDRDHKAIFFTSNRNGTFDIFRATLPDIAPTALHQLPGLTNVAVERVPELSSVANDKCPFILGNRLVFTSNRSGGFGGYDLYYSIWDGNRWLAPVNFGPAINTASDEYRPILTGTPGFTNQLMIFSSNRPGGKGGFDLYRVGIPKAN